MQGCNRAAYFLHFTNSSKMTECIFVLSHTSVLFLHAGIYAFTRLKDLNSSSISKVTAWESVWLKINHALTDAAFMSCCVRSNSRARIADIFPLRDCTEINNLFSTCDCRCVDVDVPSAITQQQKPEVNGISTQEADIYHVSQVPWMKQKNRERLCESFGSRLWREKKPEEDGWCFARQDKFSFGRGNASCTTDCGLFIFPSAWMC